MKRINLGEVSLHVETKLDSCKEDAEILEKILQIPKFGFWSSVINTEELIDKILCMYVPGYKSKQNIYNFEDSWHDDFDGNMHTLIDIYADAHYLKYGKVSCPALIIDQSRAGRCDRDGITAIQFATESQLIDFVSSDNDLSEQRSDILSAIEEAKKKYKIK